jgi:MFS family permease
LLFDAASYLAIVAAGLLLRTRRGGVRTTNPQSGSRTAPPTPAWRLHRDPLVLAMTVAVAGVVAGVGAINVVELFFVRETLGASTTAYGVVTGMWTAGVIFGAWLLTGRARRTSSDAALVRAMLVLLAGDSVIVLVAAGVPAVGWLLPLWLLGGGLNGGLNVFSNVVMARRVPSAARGRAFAAMGAAVQGAAMLGYLLGGALLAYVAPRPLVAACGLAGLVAVAAVVLPVRRAARRERVAREQVPPHEPAALGAPSRTPDAEQTTSPVAA